MEKIPVFPERTDEERIATIFDNLKQRAINLLHENRPVAIKVRKNPFLNEKVIAATLTILDSAKIHAEAYVDSDSGESLTPYKRFKSQ